MESRWERKHESFAKGAVVGTRNGVGVKIQGGKIGASLLEACRWSRGEERELGGSECPSVTNPPASQTYPSGFPMCVKRGRKGGGRGATKGETEEENSAKNPL